MRAQVGPTLVVALLMSCAEPIPLDEARAHSAALVAGVQVAVPVAADTFVEWATPHEVRGGETFLRVDRQSGGRAILTFDEAMLLTLVGNTPIVRAELQLQVVGNDDKWPAAGAAIAVHTLAGAWTEAAATWSCRTDADTANEAADCAGATAWAMDGPSAPFAATPLDTKTITSATSQVVSFDVTLDVNTALASATQGVAFLVKKVDETEHGRVDFGAREDAAHAARLVVTRAPGVPPALPGDSDGDLLPDGNDPCPSDPYNDVDADTVCGDVDNCGAVANTAQGNADADALGDACDLDKDGDAFTVYEGDCDDASAAEKPTAAETCGDAIDQDCNGYDDDCPPADPATVAPAPPRGVAATTKTLYEFLYTGATPTQKGVATGVVDAQRITIVRGVVHDTSASPLAGVRVSALGYPDLGRTTSRTEGEFDLVVNGGGVVTLQFEKGGYAPVQRSVRADWQEQHSLDAVVMTPLDTAMTEVTLRGATSLTVHQAMAITDADGTRQATLMFPAGTIATVVKPDGTRQRVPSARVRVTEYTVGDEGPRAMPAVLPPRTAYTYAAEFSIDEAIWAGSSRVEFSEPVVSYVENFLGVSTGMHVPFGMYDRQRGGWEPLPNGRVVEILSITGGAADLDVDGDGVADTGAALSALAITTAERQALAGLYGVGDTLWRARVPHFSPGDLNYVEDEDPDLDDPEDESDEDSNDENCTEDASIIEVEDQILGESFPIVGTGMTLNYRSDRVPGRAVDRTVRLKLLGATWPTELLSIEVVVDVAGQRLTDDYLPAANLTATFVWDGKDAYGRPVYGAKRARATVKYIVATKYIPENCEDVRFDSAYADFCASEIIDARQPKEVVKTMDVFVHNEDMRSPGLGGWSLSPHHRFDRETRQALFGDGRRLRSEVPGATVTTFATTEVVPYPQRVDVAADGSVYIADWELCQVLRFDRDGDVEVVAGNDSECATPASAAEFGDDGPAVDAFTYPLSIAVAPDGSLYIAEGFAGAFAPGRMVRRVGTDGIIRRVAGTGVAGFSGDQGPAVLAQLGSMVEDGIDVGSDGSLYIADWENERIRRVTVDGTIDTFAGNGTACTWPTLDEGESARSACMLPTALAAGPDEDLYFIDYILGWDTIVKRIRADGVVEVVAGIGTTWPPEGHPARDGVFGNAETVDVAANGDVYLRDGEWIIYRFDGAGITHRFTGDGSFACEPQPENIQASLLSICAPHGLSVGPDGALYLVEDEYVRRFPTSALPGFDEDNVVLPDQRGILVFDAAGRHLETRDPTFGFVRHELVYDPNGLLVGIVDHNGLTTEIERDGSGNPTAIVAPYGQRTEIELNDAGWIETITDDADNTKQFTYVDADGLLATYTDEEGRLHEFTYAADGRLELDEDPAGGSKALDRTTTDAGAFVVLETAEGRQREYAFETLVDGTKKRYVTSASGLTMEGEMVPATKARKTTFPDGKIVRTKLAPDPRWGMKLPLVSERIVQLGGSGYTDKHTRTVTLTDPDDLFSLSSQTDTLERNGKTTTIELTISGTTRTRTTTSPEGRTVTQSLDAFGRVTKVEIPEIYPIHLEYDDDGRLEVIRQGTGVDERVTTLTYVADGLLETITDPLLRTTTYDRDVLGRVTDQTLPGSRTITAAFDDVGNVTSLTPPSQPAHALDYTPVDLVETYTPPSVDGGTFATDFDYNLDRQLDLVTRPDTATIDHAYDTGGRLSSTTIARGTITRSYHATTGQLVSMTAPGSVMLAFTYAGPMLDTMTWSGPVVGSVSFGYTSGYLVSSTNFAGDTTSFSYDNDELLIGAGSATYARNPDNALLEEISLGVVETAFAADDFGALATATTSISGVSTLDLVYTRDKLGRIVSIEETTSGGTDLYEYFYDDAGRLEEVKKDSVVVATYAYDGNGNRTSGPGSEVGVVDDQDRLVSYGNFSYTYTPNGELETKTDTTTSAVTEYVFDELGNLLHVDRPTGGDIDYVIDPLNRRIGKKVGGAFVQKLLYLDQLRVAAELDASNNVVATFVYGSRSNTPDFMYKAGSTYRIVSDHLGSPRLVVNTSTGAVAQAMSFDEFGRVLTDTNPGFQPFGFAGGLYDRDTGLVRFGARDYDPTTGRWTAKDPIRFAGGDTNLYAYVASDPANQTDPSGTCPPCAVFLAAFLAVSNAAVVGGGTATAVAATTVVVGGAATAVAVGSAAAPAAAVATVAAAGAIGALTIADAVAIALSVVAIAGTVGSIGGGTTSTGVPGTGEICEPPDPEQCYNFATLFFDQCFAEWSPVYGAVNAHLWCQQEAESLEQFCRFWLGIL